MGTERKSVILMAYYFPPLVGIASDRMGAYVRHLPAHGWEPTVITPRSGFFHRSGEASEVDDGEAARVLRTSSFEVSRLLRRSVAATTGAELETEGEVQPLDIGSLGAGLRTAVRASLYIPDAQVGWIPFATRAAVDAAAQAGTGASTVLFSSSVPFSAHFAAMRAAARSGLPWVAEFRDPWAELHPARKVGPGWRWALNERLHRLILARADRIVVTGQMNRDAVIQELGADPARVRVVMNGFESVEAASPPDPSGPMQLLYAGSVDAGEQVEPLLTALDALHRDEPGSFVLRVLGPRGPWQVDGNAARPWLRLDGLVTPSEARTAMTACTATVIIQASPLYRPIVRGKLFEYAGARRPVLALLLPDTESEQLLRAHADVRVVLNPDPDSVLAACRQLLREHRAGSLTEPSVSEATLAPLSRSAQVGRLAAILDELAPA